MINSHQAHQIAAHPFHHLPMGVHDDNPSSFVGIIMALDVMLGWRDLQAVGKIWPFTILVQLFSQKPNDQQPSSTSDCCSSFSSSPNGPTR
jgi:hypothetical protein